MSLDMLAITCHLACALLLDYFLHSRICLLASANFCTVVHMTNTGHMVIADYEGMHPTCISD